MLEPINVKHTEIQNHSEYSPQAPYIKTRNMAKGTRYSSLLANNIIKIYSNIILTHYFLNTVGLSYSESKVSICAMRNVPFPKYDFCDKKTQKIPGTVRVIHHM